MKKLIILLLLFVFGFTSCGRRRYKCGPYRKCDTKEIPTKVETLQKEKTYISES